MNVVQGQNLLYSIEIDEPDNNILSELRCLLIRIRELISNITTIDEAIRVSKYVFRYNCRLPSTKYDLKLMRSVENHVLTWLVDISDELDQITVYDNYIEALNRMENMLRNVNK